MCMCACVHVACACRLVGCCMGTEKSKLKREAIFVGGSDLKVKGPQGHYLMNTEVQVIRGN